MTYSPPVCLTSESHVGPVTSSFKEEVAEDSGSSGALWPDAASFFSKVIESLAEASDSSQSSAAPSHPPTAPTSSSELVLGYSEPYFVLIVTRINSELVAS